MSELQTPLLLAGIACIVAAIVGGGLKLLGAEFPLLQSLARQVLLAVAGSVLIVGSVLIPSAAETQRAEDRATLATSFSQRLNNVGTELNRVRSGQPPPDGFFRGSELVPLTDIWNDLYGNRARLGEDLYNLLIKKARLTLRLANEGNTHELLQEFTIVDDALTKEIASQ